MTIWSTLPLPLDELLQQLVDIQPTDVPDLTFSVEDNRLWIRLRGGSIGNWRAAGSNLVFESSVGTLAIVTTLETAMLVTMAEVADVLTDESDGGATSS